MSASGRSLAWIFKTLFILAIVGSVLVGGLVGAVFWHFSKDLPNIITVADYRPLVASRVIANGGGGKDPQLVGEFAIERRYLIPYEKIPEHVIRAFTSAEDDQFFEHSGINIISILRASIANFRAGHVVQGGSTITQQVAKSLLLTSERSFVRKIKEVILASRIEQHLTKPQILYLYLNQIYLGHSAYGVQAASHVYFRKDVSQLNIAEAALIAGMPQAPGKYSPLLNPKKAKERQLYVLRRMFESRFITQAQMTEAAAQPLRIYHDDDVTKELGGYYVEQVRRYLVEKYGDKAVYQDGLTAYVPTTAELLRTGDRTVREGLEAVDKRIGYRGPLKHLNSQEEIEKFLKQERLNLIERKLKCQVFMPDGRMDPYEAIKANGLVSDAQLLDQGELYQAVVLSVDDIRKTARVMMGAIPADLPFEKMKWARPARDEKNPSAPRLEPKVPSNVLSHGDVILVKLVPGQQAGASLSVSLEQEPQVQAALFSMEASTGYVLTMQGGYDFAKSEFNRAIQAMRQPGSSFKPLIYSAGIEKGYTPASIIVDSPLVYDEGDSGKWKPNNFEEKFYGDTTFRQALIKSRNIVTVKLVQSLQVPFVLDFTKRLGLNGKFNADLSVSLGSGSTSLMEMTKVYGVFPNLGRKVKPIFITKVLDRDGKLLEEQKPRPQTEPKFAQQDPAAATDTTTGSASTTDSVTGAKKATVNLPTYPLADDPDQVLDPRVAYVTSHLMKEVVTHGTGHEAQSLGRAAAGKTGTTSDYIDAWFIGFTPHVVTGAWVGFDNLRPIGPGETGARAALPIWLGFMKEAVKSYPDEDFPVPPGVIFATIDSNSGKLASPNSLNAIKEAFIEGTQPTETADKNKTAPATQSDFFKEDID